MAFLVSFIFLFWVISYLLAYPANKCYWTLCFGHNVPSVYDAPTVKQQEGGEMAVLIDNLDVKVWISLYSLFTHRLVLDKRTILFPNTRWLYQRIRIGLIADNLNTALGPLWQSLTAIDPGMDRVRYNSHQ